MVHEQIEQMLVVVEQQINLLRDLSAMAERKSRVLVKGDMQALDTLIKGEQTLTYKLGRLEEQRFSLQAQIARAEDMPPEALSLEEIISRVPAELAQRCSAVAEEFAKAVDNLQFHNQVNSELAQQAMAFTEYNLQILGAREASKGATAYTPGPRGPGQRRQGDVKRLDGRA